MACRRHVKTLRLVHSVLVGLVVALTPFLWAQSSAKKAKELRQHHLALMETVLVPSEIAQSFRDPLKCDSSGNLYLDSDELGVAGIRKLSPKGKRLALFQPNANPELKIVAGGYFSVAQDGELYQIVFPENEITRYVMVFKSDGSYKSKIKLQPGFPWIPSALAPFASGNLLAEGQEYDRDPNHPMWPFTGIFSSDGTLLKELKIEDDDALNKMTMSADSRVVSPGNPMSNRAISFTQMEAAPDGNIYLMRWLSPAMFIVISPGGEVVRRFSVDPGDENYRPAAMHVSGSRIAVLFFQPQTMQKIMKIVDVEGHDIAAYDEPVADGKPKLGFLGLGFACYTSDPERFTFLSTGENGQLDLRIAEPR